LEAVAAAAGGMVIAADRHKRYAAERTTPGHSNAPKRSKQILLRPLPSSQQQHQRQYNGRSAGNTQWPVGRSPWSKSDRKIERSDTKLRTLIVV